ncbi:PDR/VanB family oxidoreductase [Aromatoleum toluclasticum]|uniref:PDR/VanB family oxidoreductase n=1 Tax=Aromatoleum toluclasticum TaxID=92003 RepID=UPI0003725BB3|nr:PDR/VanB family oxidoreductase [Aromatoleum toluclasticum]
MRTFELEIRSVTAETALIRAFELVAPDGGALPAFSAGAHLQIAIPGLAEPRCYSLIELASDAAAFERPTRYRLGVRIEDASRGGSRFMHALKAGDRVTVTGPKNEFALHEPGPDETPVVLLAGGIGITPVASMAAALKAAGRPFVLHYSGRSRDQLAFVDALAALAGDALVLHTDDDPMTRLEVGALLDSVKQARGEAPHLYVCGPKGMIDATIDGAKARGWPAGHVHFELFAAAAPVAGDQPFELELRQSGRILTVPADKTIVDVMEAAGCDPMFDCKRGECGVCTATVLEGVPDHRDYFLTDSEKAAGKLIQICISRAKSARLVLDL